MDEDKYIKDRVDNQINWFNNKSTSNKKKYILFRSIVIILSVSIPFATGYIDETQVGKIVKIAVGLAGVIIAALEGLQALHKYQENWVQYRTSAESLTQEKMLYSTQSGIYVDKDQAFKNFVAKIEGLLNSENQQWTSYATAGEEKDDQA